MYKYQKKNLGQDKTVLFVWAAPLICMGNLMQPAEFEYEWSMRLYFDGWETIGREKLYLNMSECFKFLKTRKHNFDMENKIQLNNKRNLKYLAILA